MNDFFVFLYQKDIDKLLTEIEAFPNDELLWEVRGSIANSAGNLCLHLCGNLQHFIGAELGHTGYVRQRDLEFSDKGLSRLELVALIHKTKQIVTEVLNAISPQAMVTTYPGKFLDSKYNTTEVLIYFSNHFAYHLGQINYIRRLIS